MMAIGLLGCERSERVAQSIKHLCIQSKSPLSVYQVFVIRFVLGKGYMKTNLCMLPKWLRESPDRDKRHEEAIGVGIDYAY